MNEYLNWLKQNWKHGRIYLWRVAILDSAKKRLADEIAEIEKLEKNEYIEKPSRTFTGDVMNKIHEDSIARIDESLARLRASFFGENADEILRRIRVERWEREAVERVEGNLRAAKYRRENLGLFEGFVHEAQAEFDACTFENYSQNWFSLDVDEWYVQLSDRLWALGMLDSPSNTVSTLEDVFCWFINNSNWAASISAIRNHLVAHIEAPDYRDDIRSKYKSVTRWSWGGDALPAVLLRAMITFLDLNFYMLRYSEGFDKSLRNFFEREIKAW